MMVNIEKEKKFLKMSYKILSIIICKIVLFRIIIYELHEEGDLIDGKIL